MVKRSLSRESKPFHSRLPARRSITVRESVEILAFQTPGRQIFRLLPMALATVTEETPGVECFQAIQTAPDQLAVRLRAGLAITLIAKRFDQLPTKMGRRIAL